MREEGREEGKEKRARAMKCFYAVLGIFFLIGVIVWDDNFCPKEKLMGKKKK